MKNPRCDNDKCVQTDGEVRLLPTGGDGHMIVCFTCYMYEMNYRRMRNRQLSADCQFKLPTWESLKVYES